VIAEVAFDAPLAPLAYRVPPDWRLQPGQRVVAPLRGSTRVGVVVALREGEDPRLKSLVRVLDPAPWLGSEALELVRWIAAQSRTSFGSTCLALLPPASPLSPPDPGPAATPGDAPLPVLLTGAGRETRLLEVVGAARRPALVLVPDVDAAARWAQRLARLGPVARLDSAVPDAERAAGWTALGRGDCVCAVGMRSAWLAPLPPGAVLAVVDEHDHAHRPPGHPRIHPREVALARGARQGLQVYFTSPTPSVELWWRARGGGVRLAAGPRAPWPALGLADSPGIGRRDVLTPQLSRAIHDTLAAGRRVLLVVSRRTSALGCDECGAILRCPGCAIALSYAPVTRALACRICGRTDPPPSVCPVCRGRRLTAVGWGLERVEEAVRRRFARARLARYDPETARGRRAELQRAAAQEAEVTIGTRGALRLFGPGLLGLVGFLSFDHLLGVPDFRAAERAFAALWAAAERVRPDGVVFVQTRNADHHAVAAVRRQDLAAFYERELAFRREAGYPPFRRLARVTVAHRAPETATQVAAVLRAVEGLTVYPPIADRRRRHWHVVVKGEADLPERLHRAFERLPWSSPAVVRGIIDVEVDPLEWPF
jgi:primosomal protein N' (replication factor Y)